MIKIITGYSGPGGSTIALRNLCKEFLKRDIPCEMYGPHDWFIDSKYTKLINEVKVDKDDKLITHFIDLNQKPPLNRTILFCHEMWWFDFTKHSKSFDHVVFLNERQRDYHTSKTEIKSHSIIPNVKEIILCAKHEGLDKIAGIIGAIEPRKGTKESIQRALSDGCEKVYLFGVIQDNNYFKKEIEPLLSDKVVMAGFQSKNKIYSMVGRVYHSSNGEVASLVKDECYTTNTKFFGNSETDNEVSNLSNDEVIELWKQTLML